MADLEARLAQVRESAAVVVATRDAVTTEQERVDKLRQAARSWTSVISTLGRS